MARKHKSPLTKLIRQAYRSLSFLNTVNTLASGDPVKIAKHFARKRTTKWGGSLIPRSK